MEAWNAKETLSTRAYLKMGQYMLRAYTEKDLTVQQRAMFAWAPILFLCYWKAWLTISGLNIENHFVSLQTYDDFVLSGHSLIMSMKMFSSYFPNSPFQPWTFGSNSCKDLFSTLRGFTRGKSDLCLMDMIDLAGRVQKLEELKMEGKKVDSHLPMQWPENIDERLKLGMEMAEREVLKTLEKLGMLPVLIKGNVVRLDGSEIVVINNPELETFAVWDNVQEEPDENTVISSEELLDLDNGILMESLDQCTNEHRGALINLAATASLNDDTEDGSDDEVDEDSPSHCALYRENTCKYLDNTFKAPKTTNWIGCSYPSCDRWYHEQCLSLHFSSKETREAYTLICPKHKDVRKHFKDKITALAFNSHALEGETLPLHSKPKRRRRFQSETGVQDQISYSAHPNYVDYEGQYFHMAEFLSLQQGKVYRPSMSRLSRWMSCARNDFYERVEKTIQPVRTTSGVYRNDIVTLWIPSKGLSVGYVIRLVTSPSLKSTYPLFEIKAGDRDKSEKNVCVKSLNVNKQSPVEWQLTVSASPDFKWCGVSCILKVLGTVSDKTQWRLSTDMTDVVSKIPELKEIDKSREEAENLLRKEEKEKIKQGREEDMTVKLLKEILDEMGVPFNRTAKKADLIKMVKEARQETADNNFAQDKAQKADLQTLGLWEHSPSPTTASSTDVNYNGFIFIMTRERNVYFTSCCTFCFSWN